jgi:hypothetical protein
LSCAFYWGVASVWPLYHKGLIGRVLQRWLSFCKFIPSPQLNSGALLEWPSGSWSPPWPRPFSPNWAVWPGGQLKKVLVVPNVFHLRMMAGTVFLGIFNAAEMFWYPYPDQHIPVSKDNSLNLMAWFLLWHALSTVGHYIDRCVPFQIMSNQAVETSQGWLTFLG